MGMSAHVAGMQSGMALWALGLMWQRVALPVGSPLATQALAVLGLYLVLWGLCAWKA